MQKHFRPSCLDQLIKVRPPLGVHRLVGLSSCPAHISGKRPGPFPDLCNSLRLWETTVPNLQEYRTRGSPEVFYGGRLPSGAIWSFLPGHGMASLGSHFSMTIAVGSRALILSLKQEQVTDKALFSYP